MGLGCMFQHVGVYCIPKSSPPCFQLQSLLCYVRDWRFPASERAASEQPPPSESTSASESTLSHALPPSFLAAPAIDAAAGLRACPTMPWRLSSIFHSSSSCDIKSKWREGHWSLLSCPGIRSKLYSCLNLLPCTLQGSVVSSLLSALCVAKRQTSPSDKCTQTLRLR